MTKEEQDKLLEEAKLRYPPGTVFRSFGTSNRKIIGTNFKFNYDNSLLVSKDSIENSQDSSWTIYKNGQWAEIISKPEVKQPYSYVKVSKDWLHFKKNCIVKTLYPTKDKPFYVVVTEENKEVLNRFFRSKSSEYIGYLDTWLICIGSCYVYPQLGKDGWGYSSNSHNKLKDCNKITFEQFLELYPEYKEDKPKFEIGKWYKATAKHLRGNWYMKYLKEGDYGYISSNHISGTGVLITFEQFWDKPKEYSLVLLTDLSEIQQYLPYGHVDKATTIPEYVECIKSYTNKEVGTIYKITDRPNWFNHYSSIKDFLAFTTDLNFSIWFKPSTKEAYDMQNKPSLVGRYLKALEDNCQGTFIKKGEYTKILEQTSDDNVYLDRFSFGASPNRTDLWQLMPEGFNPNKSTPTNVSYYQYKVYLNIQGILRSNNEPVIFINGSKRLISYPVFEYASADKLTKKQFLDIIKGTWYTSIEGDFLEERSDDFVLPEKWCVNILNKEMGFIVGTYVNKIRGADFYHVVEAGFLGAAFGIGKKDNPTEITFEQFKKYVLKDSGLSGFEHVNHLLPEMVNPCKEISFEKQSSKTELELIPIKKLKTFNN